MKVLYPVKKRHSFKENAVEILPMMFDNMMKYRDSVVDHPRIKSLLHRMRITGKPMRYIMEIMEPIFGREFSKCLHEIKNIIELMGEIHDCDVFIVELKEYLSEFREYNRAKKDKIGRLATSGVSMLINELRNKRNNDFQTLSKTLDYWESERFRNKLIQSMSSDKTNEIDYFRSVDKLKTGKNRK